MPGLFLSMIVDLDPISALVTARTLAREGVDTSAIQEAAIAAILASAPPPNTFAAALTEDGALWPERNRA